MAFSDYSDQQIFEIWDRTSKYLNVSNLKGNSPSEVISNIKKEMDKIDKNREQTQTLINKGFVERFVETSEGKNFIEVAEAKPIKPKVVVSEKVPAVRLIGVPLNLARQTSTKRISIRVAGKFRSYLNSNIKITQSQWKGKDTVYFYNLRIKKLLTWGFVK